MPIQQTPPPGWPHTEAEKYKTHIYPEAPSQDRLPGPGENMPAGSVAAPMKRRRGGCGCLMSLLVILAMIGGLVALLLPAWSEQGDSGDGSPAETTAEAVFLAEYPEWDVEVIDRPDSDPRSVRVVAWDYARGIGRIVFVDEDASMTQGYSVRSITGENVRATDDALLDAFADTWSGESWAYIRFAVPIDQSSEAEIWNVSYMRWDEETGDWSDVAETPAVRIAPHEWYVAGPDGALPDLETTETP